MKVMSLSQKLIALEEIKAEKTGRPRLSKEDFAFAAVYEEQRQEVQRDFVMRRSTMQYMVEARQGLDRNKIPEVLWGSFIRWLSAYYYSVTRGQMAFPPLKQMKNTQEDLSVRYIMAEGWISSPPTDEELIASAKSHGVYTISPKVLRHFLLAFVGDMMSSTPGALPANIPKGCAKALFGIFNRMFRAHNRAWDRENVAPTAAQLALLASLIPHRPDFCRDERHGGDPRGI